MLNETTTINSCIGRIRRIPGGDRCHVVVVDGDARGTTLAAVADRDAVKLTAPAGRASQMNAGAAQARGDVLVFLHADTALPPTALGDIAAALGDGSAVGGAFAHSFDSCRLRYRVMSALITGLTRWNRLPYGDQAIFLRRDYFESIGGYAAVEAMEDYELVRRIKRRGDRLRVVRAPVRTSCRRFEAEGVARRVLTNAWMCLMTALGVPPSRLARHYRPHGTAVAPAGDNP